MGKINISVKKTNKAVHNRKTQKKKSLNFGLKLGGATLLILSATAGSIFGLHKYAVNKEDNYTNDNYDMWGLDKVEEIMDFFDGDDRYISQYFSMLTMKNNQLYNHFNAKNNSCIKIHISNEFSAEEKKQIGIFYDYLNNLFAKINPDYHFVVGNYTKNDADIVIKRSSLNNTYVGANCVWEKDSIVTSQIKKATITFNSDVSVSNQSIKLYLAHEMMHALLGSSDVDYMKSETFSVYNYDDVSFMINQLEKAKTKEEIESQTSGYFHTIYPIMTKEEKDSWIRYTPTDVTALIAIYGKDFENNKEKYINILKETMDDCANVYGDKQPYFKDNFDFTELVDQYITMPSELKQENQFEQ